jgi:hypothetical protein
MAQDLTKNRLDENGPGRTLSCTSRPPRPTSIWEQDRGDGGRGTRIEGAWGHIDAAWVSLIQVLDDEQLIGVSPQLIAVIDGNLPSTCPERRALRRWEAILESKTDSTETKPGSKRTIRRFTHPAAPTVPNEARETLATALRVAYENLGAKYHQLRRFQWMVLTGAVVLLTLVGTLTVIGWHEPDVIPLCFPDPNAPADVATATPDSGVVEVGESVVCPSNDSPTLATVDESTGDGAAPASVEPDASERASGGDVATVVLFGLIGAALTSVTFVTRQTPTTAVPVSSIRVSQAVLKGAIGMLAALLGLLFLRAGVVPGFTRIDTRSQLLVYAVIFGASQHLVTRLIDARSDSLVEAVSVPATAEAE